MPEGTQARKLSDRTAKGLARWLIRLFFREIVVEGDQLIPLNCPLVYAMNHPNALVDPVLILGTLPRNPRFLARHGLFGNPFIRPFLLLTGTLPVYRKQDRDAESARNLETFDACHEEFARGGVVAIFPEGVSHSEPSMMPIKTGVARIVLGVEERYPGLRVHIVPVGLTFDAKSRFRSRVLIRVGEIVDPSPEVAQAAIDPRAARKTLTSRVDEALREVTLNYPTWKEARLLKRGTELFLRSRADLPERSGLTELFGVEKKFIAGYAEMKRKHPERVASLARAVEVYDRLLRHAGLRDEHVISSYPPGHVAVYLLRTLGRLVVYLPLAVVGTLLNWLPYRITALIAGAYEKTPEQPASKKFFGGLFVYPTFWLLESVLAGLLGDAGLSLIVAALAPLTGYVAMRFNEDRHSLWEESLVFLRLQTNRGFRKMLRTRREALSEEVASLACEYLGKGEGRLT